MHWPWELTDLPPLPTPPSRHSVTEPFDEPLDRRLRSLAAEKELIEVQLAERRAATPGAIRGLVADLAERRRGGERVVEEEGSEMDGVEEEQSGKSPASPCLRALICSS